MDGLEHKFAKIIILGDVGVGKTSLIRRYCKGIFEQKQRSTLGMDYQQKRVKLKGNDELTLQIWDTAGQEQFNSLSQLYFRDTTACVLVYDITKRESYKNLSIWLQEFMDKK